MALILNIETGTDLCSVALSNGEELISLRESGQERDHASKLGSFVDEVLQENDIQPDDLDAVAVSMGPGSYTGLRIGVSLAKGLCYALNIPLIGINSLYSLAQVALEDFDAGIIDIDKPLSGVKLCPMIDARRMEVYTQIFDMELKALSGVSAEVITDQSFEQYISSDGLFVIFGNGAAKTVEVLPKGGVKYIDIQPSARGLVKAAAKAFGESKFEDVAYFEPLYLKDFVVTTSKKKLF